MSTWQPIQTAPRDGTEIIALYDCGGVYAVRIMWYFTEQDYENISPAGTIEENVGWWSVRSSTASEKVKPSYWMLMPEYPNP
jgi:hypothetical protein